MTKLWRILCGALAIVSLVLSLVYAIDGNYARACYGVLMAILLYPELIQSSGE